MTSSELRNKFLEFFKSKGHTIIPGAPLVPENDPTTLFISAGMQPLVPFLMGEKHPQGDKLVDVQKCIRTGDIDEVGDVSHLTFFEMLGNWSLGAYFKEETIKMSWEFLTSEKWLGLDKNKIAISVFEGDSDAPFDDDAFSMWKSLGVSEEMIAKLGKEDNWWGPAGETGPCGPDTEMFYWTSPEPVPEKFDPKDDRWIEIWNDVFMEYNKTAQGYEPLKQRLARHASDSVAGGIVDTGMGLERMAMILQGKDNVFETDLFTPIMDKIDSLGGSTAKLEDLNAKRIIADHIRASVFIIVDGVVPSNTGRGYVLRRLIRRAVRYGKMLGIAGGENLPSSPPDFATTKSLRAGRTDVEGNSSRRQFSASFTAQVAEVVIDIYKDVYPEIEKNKDKIFDELSKEEENFGRTLEKGLKALERLISNFNGMSTYEVSGKDVFDLFQTYGFPVEMTIEEVKNKGFLVDEDGFKKEMQKHQELSKTASAGMFKGGLADAGEQAVKYHTATHLLLAGLREVLGEDTYQKGSNINDERLRFDFNYPQKVDKEQLQKIEDWVNEKIQQNLPVEMMEMPKEEALKISKVSFDPLKYGDIVKVYKIGEFSTELCGGPHVESIGELGNFKIKKEEASSAGVRRIKAILE